MASRFLNIDPYEFIAQNRDRCPVATYMFYQSKRPDNFCNPQDPFYLAVVTNDKHPPINAKWFLSGPMGHNKIDRIMKTMAKAANLPLTERKITNTSVRKTLVQKMTDSNVPDSLQVYVTGHKQMASLNNYRTLNDTHKRAISNILSSTSDTNVSFQNTGINRPNPIETAALPPPPASQVLVSSVSRPTDSSGSSSQCMTSNKSNKMMEGLFAGSNLQGCTFNITINTVNPRKRPLPGSDSDAES